MKLDVKIVNEAITNEEQPPRRMVDCTGASFCLTDLVETDCQGHLEEQTAKLLEELVINVITDNASDHTNNKRRKYSQQCYHLLPI